MPNDEPCGNITEGRTNFCSSHNRQLRRESENERKGAEKRALQIQKAREKSKEPRKKISKVSDKQKELNAEYKILADEYKRTHPNCEAKINGYCTGATEDVHHSRGHGKYFLDVTTFIAVCRSCHIWIGDNHKEAEAKGLVFSRLATVEPHKI